MSKAKELLKDKDFCQEVLWEDHEDFKGVTEKNIYDQSRWDTFYERVFKYLPDGTFWKISWQEGSTEYQETDFDPHVVQVYPKAVETTIYVKEH